MICPTCKGVGCVGATQDNCLACNGTGEVDEVQMTNEEWFDTLSTEEKADFMSRVLGCSNCPIPKDGRSCMGTYSGCWHEIIKWLKQPHSFE